jgi:hypothetical protein
VVSAASFVYISEDASSKRDCCMARMIAEVYDALKSAGADDEKARAAAIALADTDNAFAEIRQRLRVMEWAVGANTVMLVGLVLKLIVFG